MTEIRCEKCSLVYPSEGLPFKCPICGGLWDQAGLPEIDLHACEDLTGIWRYRHTFNLDNNHTPISLGEGITPLLEDHYAGKRILFKLENLNPTGSYKDRATAVLVNHMVGRGINTAVEDSSGNAGASFAAYAARAGIHARVFIPASASGPKRRQIELYGADLVPVDGPRSAAAEAVQKAALEGTPYASHAFLPFGMDGIATTAFEIFETLGEIPGSVIGPAGQGSFMLGVGRGFKALQNHQYTQNLPVLVAVQASACAPITAAWAGNSDEIPEESTLAEGVRVRYPVRGEALIRIVRETGGQIVSTPEKSILSARNELAEHGIYVEPTSAIAWYALKLLAVHLPEPIVVLLTGSGFKYND